jgi:hypothetical protein
MAVEIIFDEEHQPLHNTSYPMHGHYTTPAKPAHRVVPTTPKRTLPIFHSQSIGKPLTLGAASDSGPVNSQAPQLNQPAATGAAGQPSGDRGVTTENDLREKLHAAAEMAEMAEHEVNLAARSVMVDAFKTVKFRALINLTPTLNKLGKRTGTVLSKDARIVFDQVKATGDWAGRAATVFTGAQNLVELWPRIEAIGNANISTEQKVVKSAALATSWFVRTFGESFIQGTLVTGMKFVPWVASHGFGADVSEADHQIAEFETRLHQVSDPDTYEALYVYLISVATSAARK